MESKGIKARWADLPMEDVRAGVRRCGFGTRDVMLVLNELQAGMDLHPHSHDFDQVALVLSGKAAFVLDGEAVEVNAGEVVLIPAGVEHYAQPIGDSPVMNLDIFAPAREDYLHLIQWMLSSEADESGDRTRSK
jgi:quercetin dioxygenase-like cupin family protein